MRVIGFSIKCWLTSVLVGSFCICIYSIFSQDSGRPGRYLTDLFEIGAIALMYSFMFSIPALIGFCIFNFVLNRFVKGESQFRIGASVVSSILWFALIFFVFGNIFLVKNVQSYLLTLPYLLGLLFGIYYYKVNFSLSQDQPNTEDILDSPL